MRFSSATERALIAARRFRWAVRVELAGADGTLRDVTALASRNWLNRVAWKWNLDQPVMSGEIQLHRSIGNLSLSPFLAASALNFTGASGAAGPQIDARRLIRISTATLAPGSSAPQSHTNILPWSADQRDASWTQSLAGMAVANIPGIEGVANTGITLTDSQGTAFNAASKSVAIPNDSNPVYAHFWVVKDADQTRFPQFALVISGGTTTGQRRTSFNTQTGADVIANTTGSGVNGSTTIIDEGSRWHIIVMVPNNGTGNTSATMTIYPAARTVQAGADNVAATGSIGLLNTMVETNPGVPAWFPIVTQATAVTISDWKEVFQGYTDKFDLGSTKGAGVVTMPMRDLGAVLQDTIIETERVYGSAVGVDGATVMQSILTDNASLIGSTISLFTPTPITIAVKQYKLAIGTSIMEALNQIARKAGAVVRYKYDSTGALRLTFYQPDRSKVTPDYIFATSEYLSFDQLDADVSGLRNVVGVPFTDSGPGGTGNRLITWSIASGANLAQYGRHTMILGQDVTSQINTTVEAQRLGDAALADTAYPYSTGKATHDLTWWVEGGDLLRYLPEGRMTSANLDLAVMQIEHVIESGPQGVAARSTITGRPNVAALYRTWLRFQDTDPTTSLLPSITVTDTPGATPANDHTITYSGIWDLLEMSLNGGAWGTPSASPFTISPNGVGGAAKVLVFRATRAGVQTTQSITIQPAGAAAALPPLVEVTQTGTPTLSSESVLIQAFLGATSAGPLTWRYRIVNALTGVGSWSAWSPNSGATTLPFTLAVTRTNKWKQTVEVEANDPVAGTSAGNYEVASRTDFLNDNGDPVRGRVWSDGNYAPRATDTVGQTLHLTIVDSRAYALNTHFNTAQHTMDAVPEGATYGKASFTRLGYSDRAGTALDSSSLLNASSLIRSRGFSDSLWALKGGEATGTNAHSSVADSRAYVLNSHFNTAQHTADNVPTGALSRVVPFSVLRASDNQLLSGVDYGATIAGQNAHSTSRQTGSYFSEKFDALPTNWQINGSTATQSLVAGVAKVGQFVLQSSTVEDWRYFPQYLAFNPTKLYRIRSRFRATVDVTSGGSNTYIGVACTDSSGTYLGNVYVGAIAVTTTVAGGWIEQTGFYKGVGALGSHYSNDARTPVNLLTGTSRIQPMYILRDSAGVGGTHQLDYITIDELDEDTTLRTQSAINSSNLIYRARGLDDANYAATAINSVGTQLHGNVFDSRGSAYLLNSHYNIAQHTADNVAPGGVSRVVPYTVLRASDGYLMTGSDQGAMVGGDRAAADVARGTGTTVWTENFDSIRWGISSGTATVAADSQSTRGPKILTTGAGYCAMAWQYKIPFDVRKLYRFRIRFRKSVAESTGTGGFYAGIITSLYDGSAANTNGGASYVLQSGTVPTVGAGWQTVDCWIKGASLANTTAQNGSPSSNAPEAPQPLNTGVVSMQPYLLLNYPLSGTPNSVMQLDFYEITEYDEDTTNRTAQTVSIGGNVKRARAWDDANFALSSINNAGLQVHGSVYDNRGVSYLLNAHYNLGVHSLDNITDGGTYGRVAGVNASHLATPLSTIGRGAVFGSKTNAQSVNTGTTPVQLTLDSAPYILGSGITRSANQFIVNDAVAAYGSWVCVAQVGWAANATGDRHAEIRRNGTVIGQVTLRAAQNNPTFIPVIAFISGLALSDAFDVYIWQDSGGALAVRVPSTDTFFTMTHLW